jgi:hypothetical protein
MFPDLIGPVWVSFTAVPFATRDGFVKKSLERPRRGPRGAIFDVADSTRPRPRHGRRLEQQVGATPRRTRPGPGSGNRRCRPHQELKRLSGNVTTGKTRATPGGRLRYAPPPARRRIGIMDPVSPAFSDLTTTKQGTGGTGVIGARESHPRALAEPDVRLSPHPHPAPIIPPP